MMPVHQGCLPRRCPTPARGALWRCLAVALLGSLASCAPEPRTVVVIAVGGLTPAVQQIRATAMLNGQTDVEVFTSNLGQFGMRLPTGASGTLALTLEGLRSDQCAVASGSGNLTVSGQSRADISISLMPIASPTCQSPDLGSATFPISVTQAAGVAGPGSGTVTSVPAGISCGATCSADFAAGVTAILSAVPSYQSLFTGWSGPCTATGGACQLAVKSAAQLTATFTATTCTSDRVCLELPTPLPATSFRGVWAASPKDLWVVGAGGKILHWDGSLLSPVPSGVTSDLYSIWGAGPNDIWVGSSAGVLLHWDGTAFTKSLVSGVGDVSGIWGSGPNNVWFIDGSNSVVRWNGAQFSITGSGAPGVLLGLWGSGLTDVWFVGTGGTVRRWDGVFFSTVPSGTTKLLSAVGGSSSSDVWVVGEPGTVLHWDGASFSSVPNTIGNFMNDVAVNSAGEMWMVGTNGAIWRHTGAGTNLVQTSNVNISALNAVWAGAAGEMWAVGDSGVIVRRWP